MRHQEPDLATGGQAGMGVHLTRANQFTNHSLTTEAQPIGTRDALCAPSSLCSAASLVWVCFSATLVHRPALRLTNTLWL